MNDFGKRFKIGLVTFVAAILFVIMVWFISGISLFKSMNEVRIDFGFINSLEIHAPVRFAGARVGEVKRIQILTEQERAEFPKNPPYVFVFVSIDKKVKIPKGTKGMVSTMGFMGEKYVELMPENRSTTTYITDNESIEGLDPTPMDTVFASAKKLADDMQVVAKKMNEMVGEMQERFPVLIAEFEKTMVAARELAADAKKLTNDAQERLPELVVQFEKTLASAQDLTGDAKKLAGDMEKTLSSARQLTEKANTLTDNANSLLIKNREDLDRLISNARQMTIYMKSLTHTLAERPWKILWGFGGPIPIEPESEKFTPPPMKGSEDSVAPRP